MPPAPALTWAIDQGAFMQITPETASWFLLRLLFLLYICLCFSLSFPLLQSSTRCAPVQQGNCEGRSFGKQLTRRGRVRWKETSASLRQTLATGLNYNNTHAGHWHTPNQVKVSHFDLSSSCISQDWIVCCEQKGGSLA